MDFYLLFTFLSTLTCNSYFLHCSIAIFFFTTTKIWIVPNTDQNNRSIPSWCLLWSGFPLRSGPGTLGNCDSETDASCLRPNQLQQTNNFPSRKICTRTRRLQTLFTSRHPLVTSQRRRNAAAVSARDYASCPSKSTQVCVCRPRIQTRTGYLARRVCEDGACNVQPSLAALAHCWVACVRALFGSGKELHGVSRQRASPGISIS